MQSSDLNVFKNSGRSYVAYLALTLTAHNLGSSNTAQQWPNSPDRRFHGNERLADSLSHRLVVGFYLINIGYVALCLRTSGEIEPLRGAVEIVCDKVGFVLVEADFRPPFPPGQRIAFRPE